MGPRRRDLDDVFFREQNGFSEGFKAALLASGMKVAADKRSGHGMFNSR